MDRPPYQVAGRLYAVTATSSTTRARISGAYALATGLDLDDLPPKLYLDCVEAWRWERFVRQEDADEWQAALHAPPARQFGDVDEMMLRGLERALRNFLVVLEATDAAETEQVPAGWDNATLLAQNWVDGVVYD